MNCRTAVTKRFARSSVKITSVPATGTSRRPPDARFGGGLAHADPADEPRVTITSIASDTIHISVAAGEKSLKLTLPRSWLDQHPLTRADLEQAEAVMVCNALRGALPARVRRTDTVS